MCVFFFLSLPQTPSLSLRGVEKLTRSSLKGFLNRPLFAYKNGRFASSFLLLGIEFLLASKKANSPFKRPSPKPHLNRTVSVFALPTLSDSLYVLVFFCSSSLSLSQSLRFSDSLSDSRTISLSLSLSLSLRLSDSLTLTLLDSRLSRSNPHHHQIRATLPTKSNVYNRLSVYWPR